MINNINHRNKLIIILKSAVVFSLYADNCFANETTETFQISQLRYVELSQNKKRLNKPIGYKINPYLIMPTRLDFLNFKYNEANENNNFLNFNLNNTKSLRKKLFIINNPSISLNQSQSIISNAQRKEEGILNKIDETKSYSYSASNNLDANLNASSELNSGKINFYAFGKIRTSKTDSESIQRSSFEQKIYNNINENNFANGKVALDYTFYKSPIPAALNLSHEIILNDNINKNLSLSNDKRNNNIELGRQYSNNSKFLLSLGDNNQIASMVIANKKSISYDDVLLSTKKNNIGIEEKSLEFKIKKNFIVNNNIKLIGELTSQKHNFIQYGNINKKDYGSIIKPKLDFEFKINEENELVLTLQNQNSNYYFAGINYYSPIVYNDSQLYTQPENSVLSALNYKSKIQPNILLNLDFIDQKYDNKVSTIPFILDGKLQGETIGNVKNAKLSMLAARLDFNLEFSNPINITIQIKNDILRSSDFQIDNHKLSLSSNKQTFEILIDNKNNFLPWGTYLKHYSSYKDANFGNVNFYPMQGNIGLYFDLPINENSKIRAEFNSPFNDEVEVTNSKITSDKILESSTYIKNLNTPKFRLLFTKPM